MATACKIASSALLVTVGFFSLSVSAFLSLPRSLARRGEAHLAPQRPGLIRTQSNGPFPLCSVPSSSLVFSFFFCLLFLSCPLCPPPLPPHPSQRCSERGWVSMQQCRGAETVPIHRWPENNSGKYVQRDLFLYLSFISSGLFSPPPSLYAKNTAARLLCNAHTSASAVTSLVFVVVEVVFSGDTTATKLKPNPLFITDAR